MYTYVILMNLTEQGFGKIKDAPARIEAASRALETAGGKLRDFYAVMGEYDYVAIVECSSDEETLMRLLGIGAAGNVRTTTLKAFSREEFSEMVKKLP